jgi:hypothetical protein
VNTLYDHPDFPAGLRAEMEAWTEANTRDEWKPDEPRDVCLYKTRKKALGPFKRQLWELPTLESIIATQEAKLRFLFEQLRVTGTAPAVGRYIRPPARTRALPASLRAAVGSAP